MRKILTTLMAVTLITVVSTSAMAGHRNHRHHNNTGAIVGLSIFGAFLGAMIGSNIRNGHAYSGASYNHQHCATHYIQVWEPHYRRYVYRPSSNCWTHGHHNGGHHNH